MGCGMEKGRGLDEAVVDECRCSKPQQQASLDVRRRPSSKPRTGTATATAGSREQPQLADTTVHLSDWLTAAAAPVEQLLHFGCHRPNWSVREVLALLHQPHFSSVWASDITQGLLDWTPL